MKLWKGLGRQRWVQVTAGTLAAEYLRFVFKTTRYVVDPPDGYARIDANLPVILAMWHGQHFMGPFMRRPNDRGKVLISHHRDAEINAIAAERLGVETIRGSGDVGREFIRKGALGAFRQMLDTLAAGDSVALTADVPKIARRRGARNRDARAPIGTADLSCRARHQPALRSGQLGQDNDQPAIQPRRSGLRGAGARACRCG